MAVLAPGSDSSRYVQLDVRDGSSLLLTPRFSLQRNMGRRPLNGKSAQSGAERQAKWRKDKKKKDPLFLSQERERQARIRRQKKQQRVYVLVIFLFIFYNILQTDRPDQTPGATIPASSQSNVSASLVLRSNVLPTGLDFDTLDNNSEAFVVTPLQESIKINLQRQKETALLAQLAILDRNISLWMGRHNFPGGLTSPMAFNLGEVRAARAQREFSESISMENYAAYQHVLSSIKTKLAGRLEGHELKRVLESALPYVSATKLTHLYLGQANLDRMLAILESEYVILKNLVNVWRGSNKKQVKQILQDVSIHNTHNFSLVT